LVARSFEWQRVGRGSAAIFIEGPHASPLDFERESGSPLLPIENIALFRDLTTIFIPATKVVLLTLC
jgi:hypothetical protein